MKKILVVTPYPLDANSFWRCMGPMNYLEKHSDGEIQITLALTQERGISWVDISRFDLVFLHRPCRNDDLVVMQIAYNLGIPVWVDYDDWLFDLPGWNPHKNSYDSMPVQSVMAQCIACADLISVSTNQLYCLFSQVNPNVVVIPNAYRSDVFSYRGDVLQDRNPIALWRGTNTHDGDLLSVREGFQNLKCRVQFMGGPTWLLLSGMKPDKYEVRPSFDVLLFNKYIYDLKPKLFLFPLVDCLFNRCKSNIAYIEAMHAGALCVAPDLPEWNRPGVITYKPHDSDEFAKAVNEAYELSHEAHETVMTPAFKAMKKDYDITRVNETRLQVVKSLTDSQFKKNPNNPFEQMPGMKALAYFQGVKRKVNEPSTQQNTENSV